MRTSAPSRAILVRRFTRTETLTAWPFFRAQAPLQLHIICNNKRKEDFYAKILQERIFHNFIQHQMVAPIDHLHLHLPQSPLLLRPPHRLLIHRHWISHANQQISIDSSVSMMKLSLLKERNSALAHDKFPRTSCTSVVFGKDRATGLQ